MSHVVRPEISILPDLVGIGRDEYVSLAFLEKLFSREKEREEGERAERKRESKKERQSEGKERERKMCKLDVN